MRDTPSAKIIRELNKAGYMNIIAYDPVAMDEFENHYGDLTLHFAESYEKALAEAKVFAITTAWKDFENIREKTDKAVVDCRYML